MNIENFHVRLRDQSISKAGSWWGSTARRGVRATLAAITWGLAAGTALGRVLLTLTMGSKSSCSCGAADLVLRTLEIIATAVPEGQ